MEKGISLVTLVITIVVMLIIAGAITFVSTDILDVADEDKLQEELTMVNNVILENYTNYLRTKNIAYIKGEKLTDTQVQEIASKINVSLVAIPTNVKEKDLNLSAYYRLTPTDLEEMGIDDATDTYIVNYLTGEVINETKAAEEEPKKYYMYSKSNFNGNITDFNEYVTDGIKLSLEPSGWTSSNVKVMLSSQMNIPTGYVTQYKIGDGNWTTGNEVTIQTNGTVVYGRLYNEISKDAIQENSITVNNIDTTVPTSPTNINRKTTIDSISVSATGGNDDVSGVAGYQYSIDGTNWSGTISLGNSYIYSGLTAQNSYTVYAKTVDNAGKTSSAYSIQISNLHIKNYITESSTIAGVTKQRSAPIPLGYVASSVDTEKTIAGGLVIYQGDEAVTSANHQTALTNRNQYVWIPVDDINDMVMCKKNGQSGTNGTVCNLVYNSTTGEITCNTHSYTTSTTLTTSNIDTIGLAGRLYGVASKGEPGPYGETIYKTNMDFTVRNQTFAKDTEYREPDLVTTYDNNDATSGNTYMADAGITDKTAASLKAQLNSDFIAMAKSVAKYGGFYISRYEAGANGASLKNQKVLVAGTSTVTGYNTDTFINGNKWYGMYNTLKSSTSANKTAVNSHMIWRMPV